MIPGTTLYKTASVVFIGFCAFLFLRFFSYHLHLIQHPYPLEYREGQLLVSTHLMLKGINPFSVDQQPGNTNTYGLVYHWLMLPFAKIWGATFQTHRAVTGLCIFAGLGLLVWYWLCRRLPWTLIVGGVVAIYASLLYPVTTTALAGGNALGFLLMLACVLIPHQDQYRLRSLVLSVLLALLAFYTKSYCFLAAVFLAAYLFLFVDKKKGFLFGIGLLAALGLSVLVINRSYETYFSTTFFLNLNISGNNGAHLVKQLKTWACFHLDILAALAVFAGVCLKNMRISAPRLNVRDMNAPLISPAMDVNLFCLLGYTLLICAKLGKHEGSWMAYLFQLMTPWLLLYAFSKINRWRWLIVAWMVLMAAVFYKVNYTFAWSPAQAKGWESARILVKTHENILNSPVLVSFLLENNKPVYDGGYTQWSIMGAQRPGVWKFLKPDIDLYRRNQEFTVQLLQSITSRKFDLIMLTPGLTTFDFGDISSNYAAVGLIKTFIPHFNEDLDLAVFVPR